MISDFADQNYSNSFIAERNFWRYTLAPIDKFILKCITDQFVKRFNKDFVIMSDYSDVESFTNIPAEIIENWLSLIRGGVPKKEAAKVVGLKIDWDAVQAELDEENKKAEANKPKAPQETTNNNTEEEEIEEDTTTEDVKSLSKCYNKFFTALRNECMDRIDKSLDAKFDIDVVYNTLKKSLEDVRLPIIGTYIKASKELNGSVGMSAVDIVRILNNNTEVVYNYLKSINDNITNNKEEVHNVFDNQYKNNKTMAKTEIKELYKQIVKLK